jgi:glutamine amidotransferase
MPPEKLRLLIHSLMCKGYIKQDSRDRAKWNHDNATYYTEQSKREEINKLIGK